MNKHITLQPTFSYKKLIESLYYNNNSTSCLTNSARSSLSLALILLLKKYKHINTIYLPDFICSDIIPTIQNLKINIIFYSIGEDLKPDIDFIDNKIKGIPSIILIVNYFGKSSDWKSVLELKKNHDCIILEDNAHALYGNYNGVEFGNLGDISFNSLRKILPVLSGSVLKSKVYSFENLKKRLVSFSEFKYSLRGLNIFRDASKNKITSSFRSSFSIYDNILSIDYISNKIYLNTESDKNNICQQRRSNYSFWLKYLINSDLEIIDLAGCDCPYVLPCIPKDIKSYDKWLRWGKNNNISIINWPKLPNIGTHKLLNKRLSRVLLFPVNHLYNLNSIEPHNFNG